MKETINKINKYIKGDYSSNEEIKKEWAFAGKIPKASRSFVDRIEYWLLKNGLSTQRIYLKWHKTLIEDYCDTIDLDVKNIELKSK